MPNNLHEIAPEDKTPEELAAEIANTAADLGGHSPKDKAAKAAESSSESENIAVEAKPAQEEEQSEEAVAPAKSDDAGESVTVRVNSAKRAESTAETETEAQEEQVAEKVEESEEDANAKAEREVDQKTISHSGKTIKPLAEETADSTETEETSETDESEEVQEDSEGTEDNTEEAKTTRAEPAAAQKLNAISEELNERDQTKKEEDESKQQQAKVFDTNQYHLPIKASRHHRKGISKLTWLLLIVAALAAMAAYAYINNLGPFSEVGTDFLMTTTS